ncbi:MAG: sigma-70 family RNA polymerase sigma factor [Sciscionella sp.]
MDSRYESEQPAIDGVDDGGPRHAGIPFQFGIPPRPTDECCWRNGSISPTVESAMTRASADPSAFGVVYRHCYGLVFATVRAVLRDHAQAEEVTQEVFLEVWRHADRYHPERGSMLTWLLVIARRRAIDRVRSEQAAHLRDARVGYAQTSATGDDPAELIAERTQYDHLRRLFETLSPAQRDLLGMAFLAGRTYQQLAELLDIPLGTVKTRIHDTRKQLRHRCGLAAPRPAETAQSVETTKPAGE